jgi:hypothetical protein
MLVAAAALPLEAQTIAAGNIIEVRLEHKITTETARTGDSVKARISKSLRDNKDVVVPAGSTVQGRVDFVKVKTATEDGWLRLLFDEVVLPNGRSIGTLASASFHRDRPHPVLARLIVVPAFATIGALLGGRSKRVAGGLGGAIAGVVLLENKHRYGRDMTLREGQTIHLRLSADLY